MAQKGESRGDGNGESGDGRGQNGARFEEALAELEGVVRRLEHGELPLEDSLAAFERGMTLVKELGGRLEAIEQRVEVLLRTAGGTLATRTLDEDE